MKFVAYLLIMSANILGGASYLGQEIALRGLPPATVIVIRTLVAIVCCGLWLLVAGSKPGPSLPFRQHLRLATIGILAFGAPLLLGIIGLEDSTSGNASILILMEPATILFVSWLLLREHIRRQQLVGIVVSLAGACMLVFLDHNPDSDATELFRNRGNLILALHGVLWGLYSPLMKPIAHKYDAVKLTTLVMLYSLLLATPMAIAERDAWQAGPHLKEAWIYSIALGVLVSFAATFFWNISLRHIKASAIAPFIFLQPLAGTLAGYWVLGEKVSQGTLWGGSVIVVGVALVVFRFGGSKNNG